MIFHYTVIAKRRIGQTSQKVSEFILNTDLDGLLPEHCELLLKFIPSEEEVSNLPCCNSQWYVYSYALYPQLSDLAKHAHRNQEFGEAERFMFDVSSSLL